MKKIRIGTRTSNLAMWQTNFVKELIIKYFPQSVIEIVEINTKGDKILDKPLSAIGSFGLFTKELESELLENNIDIAVHSLKDLESDLPDGLILGAVPTREDHRDVIISKSYESIHELPDNGNIFTGSLRRKAQLLKLKPDLNVHNIRGNVETRIKKYNESGFDGLIMASAGLHRLGKTNIIGGYLDVEDFLPAVGQGALGIEIRENDNDMINVCNLLNNETLYKIAIGERSFLNRIQGGCSIPVAGLGEIQGNKLNLQGMLSSIDGKTFIRKKIKGELNDGKNLGKLLAEEIINSGGKEILSELGINT